MPRLGLRANLALLVLVPFTIVAVAGLVAYQAVVSAREATDRLERSNEVILTASLVVKDAVDAETGARGFLLVGDPEFLAPYDAATQSFPARISRLERLVAADPAQVALVQDVQERFQQFDAELAQPAIERRRAGSVDLEEVAAFAVSTKALVDGIRGDIDAIVTAERTAGGAEAAAERERSDDAAGVAILSAVAASILALVAALVSARLMGARLGAISAGARALATEEDHPRLKPAGHDEIAELGRTFNEMADQLDARKHELESTNRELESFSYTVSHDLRAPLRSIAGFGQILEEEHQDDLGPEGQRLLGRIRAATARMSELIDDLLELARVSTGDLQRVPVDISRVCEEILDGLRAHEPAREVTAVVAPGLEAPGDPRLLRAALENLLGNAWKFTAKRPDAHIWVRPGPMRPGYLSFVVEDDGAGFDMAYADTLFAPFRRLHREEDFSGTGIGLATVRRIVERHDGTIEAHGVPGEGARITVRLPR